MTNKLKHIAMLSTHGYFDPIPQLGRTDTGGQVVYVLELAKALSRIGIKVDIFTRWFDSAQEQVNTVPDHPDVRVIRIAAGPWDFIPKEFIYDVLPELAKNMIRCIDAEGIDYDLYHGHYVDAGIVALDVARMFKKPVYFTAHSLGAWKKDQMGGDPAEMEKKFNFNHRIEEELRIFKAVNGQSLTSKVQLEKLNELYNYSSSNIDIIPPGVDIHKYKVSGEVKEEGMDDMPKKYIYCLSRLDTNKGHDLLLKAFALVKDKVSDVDLVIGGGSPNPSPREQGVMDMMDTIIKENNMENRVKMIGYVPDSKMLPNYQNSEMFVLPSLFEPFGMTSQEAMACGKPVVASKFGGIRNVITDGETGLLIDPKNAEEFAGAMINLLEDSALNNKIGSQAYEMIREEFSWEAIANKHLEFYARYMGS